MDFFLWNYHLFADGALLFNTANPGAHSFSFVLIGCILRQEIRKTVGVSFCGTTKMVSTVYTLLHVKVYLVFDL